MDNEIVKNELANLFEEFENAYVSMTCATLASGMLAKLLGYTDQASEDKQAWKIMIADLEGCFFTEKQQMAYGLMH